MDQSGCDVRFSNRPAGVKRFQTVHGSGVDVTRGLVLLYGIGTWALPSWDSKTRWNDLLGDLAVGRSKRTRELTSSIVPRGTPFHHLVELGFPPTSFDLVGCSRGRSLPSKMLHAAFLLLMLEAASTARFTISLKRSTQNSFSYPQAAGR